MANDLILNSLLIQGFRGIRELRIGRLGRVNLIVGKNNVGKSTVLEALRLYAHPGWPADIIEILIDRSEIPPSSNEVASWRNDALFTFKIDSLFHGRETNSASDRHITIGPVGELSRSYRIALEKTVRPIRVEAVDYQESKSPLPVSRQNSDEGQYYLFETKIALRFGGVSSLFPVERRQGGPYDKAPAGTVATERLENFSIHGDFPIRPLHVVPPNGLEPYSVGVLWDKLSLSPAEEDVLLALRIISADVERVALKESEGHLESRQVGSALQTRIPYVKIKSQPNPIPMRVLGDGLNRIFGLILSLVNAKDGFLLVDEIENGIHYSVQADLWRLIFQTAAKLNVQVFATTHSFDCIRAFEEAARESEEEGVVVRLAKKGGETLVAEFDEDELSIAVDSRIEIR